MIKSKSDKYRYSKYLVLKLLTTMAAAPSQVKDQVVQDFYLYASSGNVFCTLHKTRVINKV